MNNNVEPFGAEGYQQWDYDFPAPGQQSREDTELTTTQAHDAFPSESIDPALTLAVNGEQPHDWDALDDYNWDALRRISPNPTQSIAGQAQDLFPSHPFAMDQAPINDGYQAGMNNGPFPVPDPHVAPYASSQQPATAMAPANILFTHPLPLDIPYTYQDGSGAKHVRAYYRLFPEAEPWQRWVALTSSDNTPVIAEVTGQQLHSIPFLPQQIDFDDKTVPIDNFYHWGAPKPEIAGRIVKYKRYVKKDGSFDAKTSLMRLNNVLSARLQRSRVAMTGGLLPGFDYSQKHFANAVTFLDVNGVRKLIPMGNLLFGVRYGLLIDMNRMTFRDLDGREHPFSTPTEVSGRTLMEMQNRFHLTPWTLNDLHQKHPHTIGYRQELHPLFARRKQEDIDLYNVFVAEAANAPTITPQDQPKEAIRRKRKHGKLVEYDPEEEEDTKAKV
ncbi:hypothetical protein EJ08DRAFT_720103 [Tothia fuscella]|uniref:Uncharacterized protein n=1 Tax=Tothia fuscella TaxID=1048955 RepID=A0A9P4P0R3_9PEZI|nr:hypothetical protein EJ08DRAFT_720103 [Tothia fuscella]